MWEGKRGTEWWMQLVPFAGRAWTLCPAVPVFSWGMTEPGRALPGKVPAVGELGGALSEAALVGMLPEPHGCDEGIFSLLQSPAGSSAMVVPSLHPGATAPVGILAMWFLTMPAAEEEEESSEEEAGVFQLPWALTRGRFPHSHPCRAWGISAVGLSGLHAAGPLEAKRRRDVRGAGGWELWQVPSCQTRPRGGGKLLSKILEGLGFFKCFQPLQLSASTPRWLRCVVQRVKQFKLPAALGGDR